MKMSWTNGIEPDVAKEIKGDFKSSLLVRKRLKTMLEDEIERTRRDARQKVNYDKANWNEYIADSLGYERALEFVISLIFEEPE